MKKYQPKGKGFNPKAYVRPGIPEWQVVQIKEAFDAFDFEGNGFIDPAELKSTMKKMGYDARNHTIYQVICDLEAEGSGNIHFQQFLEMMGNKGASSNSRQMFRTIFNCYDDEKTGYISVKNLRKLTRDMGLNIGEQELEEMVEKADLDKDGLVSEEEFYNVLTKQLF